MQTSGQSSAKVVEPIDLYFAALLGGVENRAEICDGPKGDELIHRLWAIAERIEQLKGDVGPIQ